MAVAVNLKRSRGSEQAAALLTKWGNTTQQSIEFWRAVFGAQALIGKLILVRFNSPLRIFLPISLIISFPTDLSLSTCFLSPHVTPPSL